MTIKESIRRGLSEFFHGIHGANARRNISFSRKLCEASKPSNSTHVKKIFFNTQYHTHFSWIDYSIAAALKERGCHIEMMVCSGLPYCERMTYDSKRPACHRCIKQVSSNIEAFGLNYVSMGDYLSEEQIKCAFEKAQNDDLDTLKELVIDGYPIGEIAYRNLLHFTKGVADIYKEEAVFRDCIQSSLISFFAMQSYLGKHKPDVVVSTNGKFIQSAYAVLISEKLGVPYITWEVFSQFTGAIFARNSLAMEQKLDEDWGKLKQVELTQLEKESLYHHFGLQRESKNTPYRYYEDNVISDDQSILSELNIKPNSTIVSLFANVEWDSTALGMDAAFDNMRDWICTIIDYAYQDKDLTFVIRTHPGELKVPNHLKTTLTLSDSLVRIYPELPDNVKIIEPESPISSYTLADLSAAVMVYSSTLGLEFALQGIRPWVMSNCYYRGKGFTLDFDSRDQVIAELVNRQFDKLLSDSEVNLAEKFAYAVRFRRLFRFPFFNEKKLFFLNDYRELQPGGNEIIDRICDHVLGRHSCLDFDPVKQGSLS